MGLNIKSDRAHDLARQLARETGTSMTAAVEKALEDQLTRVHRHAERESRYQMIKEIVSRLPPAVPGVTSDHTDLYDDDGLPV